MKLRPRLALTAAALTIPLAIVSLTLDRQARDRATTSLLVEHVRAKLEGDGARQCATSPRVWAFPGPLGALPPPPPPPFPPAGAPFPPPLPSDSFPPPPPFPPPNGPSSADPFFGALPPDGPPIRVFVYDQQYHPVLPASPALDESLVARARGGETVVRDPLREQTVLIDRVLVRASEGARDLDDLSIGLG